jgi:uncharacterized repeat protein (TIGR03803 family)
MKHEIYTRITTITLLIVGMAIFSPPTQSQTFTVLHTFTGVPDGAYPVPSLVRDETGHFYGTTEGGGPGGDGTVFKISTSGEETTLYAFTASEEDGAFPFAPLVYDGHGSFFGTTSTGGAFHSGTVFKVDKNGKETVLYNFTGGLDGSTPYAGLVLGKDGNIYGTTQTGGSGASFGTIFKVDAASDESVLYAFDGGAAGEYPFAGLNWDRGNLFGTTAGDGSSNYGTVFQLTSAGKETLLHSFTGEPDGAFPIAVLIKDSIGNLFGTTQQGGVSNFGTVFELDTTGALTVLYNFTGSPDGKWPYAGLLKDAAGNLYGTTALGGTFDYGAIFKLDTTGKLTILYSFTGGADGAFPRGGLIRDNAGNMYGTASNGGVSNY